MVGQRLYMGCGRKAHGKTGQGQAHHVYYARLKSLRLIEFYHSGIKVVET